MNPLVQNTEPIEAEIHELRSESVIALFGSLPTVQAARPRFLPSTIKHYIDPMDTQTLFVVQFII